MLTFLFIICTPLLIAAVCFQLRKIYREEEYYMELAEHYRFKGVDIDLIRSQQKEYPGKVLRKYIKKHPEELLEAKKVYKKKLEEQYKHEESKKRELIKARVFAYDYEEMLYQIYAPFAEQGTWGWFASTNLRKKYIIMRISEIKSVSEKDAINIFNILKEHKLLQDLLDDDTYFLTPLLDNLSPDTKQWDVVSDTDMNLNKWILAHPGLMKNKSSSQGDSPSVTKK